MAAAEDQRWMRAALSLARRGLGRTWPNPAVGCFIIGDGQVVGQGWTQPGGRPHAETEALTMAGGKARGATAYVSLEPCSHHGRTPPCAEALAGAGIVRVVAACGDPDPRVSGRGIEILKSAGLAVTEGVLQKEAMRLNAGFIKRHTKGLPFVTLKLGTTLDGRIATASGDSQWITGPEARRHGHYLRGTHDAIMVGRATAEADDPSLTCRLAGMEDRSPVRVVADSHGRLPHSLKLFTGGGPPTWRIAGSSAAAAPNGIQHVETPLGANGQIDVEAGLRALAKRGITRLLVEGGGSLAASLIRAELVDRIELFQAPAVIGGDGLPGIAGLGIGRIDEIRRFSLLESRVLGDDMLSIYEPKRE